MLVIQTYKVVGNFVPMDEFLEDVDNGEKVVCRVADMMKESDRLWDDDDDKPVLTNRFVK